MRIRILFFVFFSTLITQPNVKLTQAIISFTGSHPFHDWTGISTNVNLKTNCLETEICDFTFTIPWTSFDSGNDNRDNNMLYYVNAFDFPNIEMKFKQIDLSKLIEFENSITGILTINGINQNFSIGVDYQLKHNHFKVSSSFDISLDNFKINRPSLLLIPIDDLIYIHVDIDGIKN